MASNTVNLSTYKAKILSNTYGANNKPIYFNDGVPTILTTIGKTSLPVWVDNGAVKTITSYEGNAATATKLETAREIYVALGTTRDANSKVTFDGSADKAIHVSGTLAVGRGGTGKTSWTKGGIIYASATDTLAQIADGSADKVLRATASATYSWLSYTSAATASTLVYRDASKNFSAGTITATLSGNASTADKWKTARTLTIGATGKSVDGSGNVSWSKTEIIGSGTTSQFLRGDHTWTNSLANYVFNTTDMGEAAANLSGTTSAHVINFYRNGISIPYQMDNANDGGILRVRGTSESTTIFEMSTWDDSGSGETIQFNYYPTTSQSTPTYSVAVPKETGTIFLRVPWWTSGNGNNSDNLRHGCTFAYSNHNCPTSGTLVAFDCSTSENYTLQLQGQYSGDALYFRNRNGDAGTWRSWQRVVHNSGTWDISITGNADTVDNWHRDDIRKGCLSFTRNINSTNPTNLNSLNDGMAYNYGDGGYWQHAPSSPTYGSCIALTSGGVKTLGGQFYWDINHNSSSSTRSLWFRAANNLGWQDDWKQIVWNSGSWSISVTGSSGSCTGNAATASKWQTARTLTIGNKGQSVDGSGNVSWALQDVLIRAGNEFNFTASGMGVIWFNYRNQSGSNTSTKITNYYFGNGQTSTADVTVQAAIFKGALSGNADSATTASRLTGFSSSGTSNAGWGNQTGTQVCWANDASGGSYSFRRDNPSSGKLSLEVDGRFYGNEGNYPAMLLRYANGYWGMGNPDAADDWIRTTTSGIIPNQGGGAGSGHCGLGTSTWYFSYVYADNFYGRFNGTADTLPINTSSGSGYGIGINARQMGPIVIVNIQGTTTSAIAANTVLRTLPEGYRPLQAQWYNGSTGGGAIVRFGFYSNGQITTQGAIANNTNVYCVAVFAR